MFQLGILAHRPRYGPYKREQGTLGLCCECASLQRWLCVCSLCAGNDDVCNQRGLLPAVLDWIPQVELCTPPRLITL